MLNNADWLVPLDLLAFLRDIGKHFSVNEMIKRDSVRTRLEERDRGISYTEFSLHAAAGVHDFSISFNTTAARSRWAAAISGAIFFPAAN